MKVYRLISVLVLIAMLAAAFGCSGPADSEPGDPGTPVKPHEINFAELNAGGANPVAAPFLEHYNAAPISNTIRVDGVAEVKLEKCYSRSNLFRAKSNSYIKPVSGKKLLICEGTIKNLSDKEISSSLNFMLLKTKFLVMMYVNNKDCYFGNMMFANEDGTDIVNTVAPGAEVTVYLLCFPDEDAQINEVSCYLGLGDFTETVLDAGIGVDFYGERIKKEIKSSFKIGS